MASYFSIQLISMGDIQVLVNTLTTLEMLASRRNLAIPWNYIWSPDIRSVLQRKWMFWRVYFMAPTESLSSTDSILKSPARSFLSWSWQLYIRLHMSKIASQFTLTWGYTLLTIVGLTFQKLAWDWNVLCSDHALNFLKFGICFSVKYHTFEVRKEIIKAECSFDI